MGRYLTPQRICLLTLIEIYLSDLTSTSVGSHILDLITRQIIVPLDYGHEVNDEQHARPAFDLAFWARELRQWPSDIPGRHMYDVLLKQLWEMNGLDSLNEFFGGVEDMTCQEPVVADTQSRRISRTSPLGQFVRRCCVEFTRLQFNDSRNLWNMFVVYRHPSYDEWCVRNPDEALHDRQDMADRLPIRPNIENFDGDDSGHEHPCVADIDDLMTTIVQNLQKFGTRLSQDVKDRLEVWISTQREAGTQSIRFFIAFFEHWRAGQYSMALESLHQYFDYSLAARRVSDNMRAHYQYALLHLSVLHADFECWDESVDAMNECIATGVYSIVRNLNPRYSLRKLLICIARENQDTGCLNFALSWLLYLRHASPRRIFTSNVILSGATENGDRDETTFLKSKARESKQWLLLSSTLLEQAKSEIYSNGNNSRAQEYILQSMYLNARHDLRAFMPAAAMLYGAAMERLGQTHVAVRTYEGIIATHASSCPLPDKVNSTCRLAYLSASRGEYDLAASELATIAPDTCKVPKHNNRMTAYTYLIHFRKSLDYGRVEDCFEILPQLSTVRHLNDPDFIFEVRSLEMELLIQTQQLERATTCVNELLVELELYDSDIAQRVSALCKRSQILAHGIGARKVLTNVLQIASLAEQLLLPSTLSTAVHLLTCVLAEHMELSSALDVSRAVAPLAIVTQDRRLILENFLSSADMCAGGIGQVQASDSSQVRQYLRNALLLVDRAATGRKG